VPASYSTTARMCCRVEVVECTAEIILCYLHTFLQDRFCDVPQAEWFHPSDSCSVRLIDIIDCNGARFSSANYPRAGLPRFPISRVGWRNGRRAGRLLNHQALPYTQSGV
jgi:hypothetical protein